MRKILRLFAVKGEELLVGAASLLVIIAMNVMMVAHYYDQFSVINRRTLSFYIKYFTVSGFDPIAYNTLTFWHHIFNVYRHPLLTLYYYPLAKLNEWLTAWLGVNTAQFIVAALNIFVAFYSIVFLYRILRQIVHLATTEAVLLTFLFLSFAYTMLSVAVPDHFVISTFALLLIFYVAGRKMQRGETFTMLQTVVIFFLAAGVTLTNGVKVYIVQLFTNGKRFFHPFNLVVGVLFPCMVIWMLCLWQERQFVEPLEKKKHAMRMRSQEKKRAQTYAAFRDTTSLRDSAEIEGAFRKMMADRQAALDKKKAQSASVTHQGKPLRDGKFVRWTDVTTPRGPVIIHNLFGESLLLHDDHLLEDVLRTRPVIVHYRIWFNYVVEFLVVLMLLAGIWFGIRSRFLWMVLSCFAFDMFIHLVLGFGLNEVYINSPHWLFTIPIASAYLLRRIPRRNLPAVRFVLVFLCIYLFLYNGSLIVKYLM